MAEAESRRIAFTVEYDGGSYFGWQLQRERGSVQGELETVLGRLFAKPVRVLGSGRTDRGVHAVGQVASVEAPMRWTAPELKRAMNALLPAEVRISHAAEVADDFHPRYSALSRSYVYRLGIAEATASPFHGRWCWSLRLRPDQRRMEAASAAMLGEHSFAAFAKAGQEERGDRCIVTQAEWKEWADLGLEFHIRANRFLHHMVRYLVGTTVQIGLGRRAPDTIRRLLDGEPGLETSPPAPARGLFLRAVEYPAGAYPTRADRGEGSLPPTIV